MSWGIGTSFVDALTRMSGPSIELLDKITLLKKFDRSVLWAAKNVPKEYRTYLEDKFFKDYQVILDSLNNFRAQLRERGRALYNDPEVQGHYKNSSDEEFKKYLRARGYDLLEQAAELLEKSRTLITEFYAKWASALLQDEEEAKLAEAYSVYHDLSKKFKDFDKSWAIEMSIELERAIAHWDIVVDDDGVKRSYLLSNFAKVTVEGKEIILHLPKALMGYIIGRQGKNIKHLQEVFNVKINVKENKELDIDHIKILYPKTKKFWDWLENWAELQELKKEVLEDKARFDAAKNYLTEKNPAFLESRMYNK